MTDILAGFMSDLAIACADFYNLDSACRSYAATQQDGVPEEMNDSYGILLAAVLESKQSVAKTLTSAEGFMKNTPKDSEAYGTVQSCYGLLNDWRMRVGSLDSNLKSIALDVSANYVDLMARSRANNPFTAPVVTPGSESEALVDDEDEPIRVIPRNVDPGDSVYIIPQDGHYEDHSAFDEPSEEDDPEVFVTEDPRSTHTGDDPGDDEYEEDYSEDDEEIYVTQEEPLEYGTIEREAPVHQNALSLEMASEIRNIVIGTMVEFMEANAPVEEVEDILPEEEQVPEPESVHDGPRRGGLLGKKSTRAKRKGGDQ